MNCHFSRAAGANSALRSLREQIETQLSVLEGSPRFYYGGSFGKRTMIRVGYDLDLVMYWPDTASVIEVLSGLMSARGVPTVLRSDNGPEFVSKALLSWIAAQNIGMALIEPGKPWQNGVTESFNGKFRDECLSPAPRQAMGRDATYACRSGVSDRPN